MISVISGARGRRALLSAALGEEDAPTVERKKRRSRARDAYIPYVNLFTLTYARVVSARGAVGWTRERTSGT